MDIARNVVTEQYYVVRWITHSINILLLTYKFRYIKGFREKSLFRNRMICILMKHLGWKIRVSYKVLQHVNSEAFSTSSYQPNGGEADF